MQCCTKCYGLVNNSVRKVSVTLWFYLQTRCELFCCVCFYQSALCRLCVFVLYGLSVCYKTLKLKKLSKFTTKFIDFYNLFKERGREPKENYWWGMVEKRLRITDYRQSFRVLLTAVHLYGKVCMDWNHKIVTDC